MLRLEGRFLSFVNEFVRECLTEEELALGDLENAPGQICGCMRLNDIATDAGFEGLNDVVMVSVDSEDNCSRSGNTPVDAAGSFDPVKVGHREIKDDDVWLMSMGKGDSLISVASFDYHLKSLPFKEGLQAPTDWHVVICQQDSQLHLRVGHVFLSMAMEMPPFLTTGLFAL